jgi:copper resistance protein B
VAPQTRETTDPHAGHDMPATPDRPQAASGDPHAGHDMSAMPESTAVGATGTDLAPGDAPAPSPPRDRAADIYWGAGAMAAAQDKLRREHGGGSWSQLVFNLAEYQARKGRDGYRWDGEAWIGGDRDRFVLKSEGSGDLGGAVESAEVQALYSRALDPYWNLQAGLRQDLGPGPRRTYAAIGVEGLAPWWFDVEAALFLSTKGELLGRIEGYYDQRITQDLVFQPRAELNLAVQDVPDSGTGAGLSDMELGLRLRYERVREFAPYVGVSWERKFGATARYARGRGDGTGGISFVAGIRTWF